MDPSTLLYTEIASLAYYVERCHTEICKSCRRHKPREGLPSIFRVNSLTPLVFCKKHLIRVRQLIGMRSFPYFFPYPRYPCDLAPDRDEILFFLASTPPPWFRSNTNFPFSHQVPPTFSERLRNLLGWMDPNDPGIGPSRLCPTNLGNCTINSFHMAAVLGWNGSARLGTLQLTEAQKAKVEKEIQARSKDKKVYRLKVAELSRRNRSGAVRRTVRTMKMKRLRSLKAQRKTANVLKRLERPKDPKEPKLQEFILQGLDLQGPDLQGFDAQGFDLQGLYLQGLDLQGFQPQRIESQGVQPQTFVPQGFQPQGFQPQGFQPQGFQLQGFQPQGFQPQGYQPARFQPQGVQPQIFVPQGFQLQGFHPQGFEPQRLQPQGSQLQAFGEWDWTFLG